MLKVNRSWTSTHSSLDKVQEEVSDTLRFFENFVVENFLVGKRTTFGERDVGLVVCEVEIWELGLIRVVLTVAVILEGEASVQISFGYIKVVEFLGQQYEDHNEQTDNKVDQHEPSNQLEERDNSFTVSFCQIESHVS